MVEYNARISCEILTDALFFVMNNFSKINVMMLLLMRELGRKFASLIQTHTDLITFVIIND